MSLTIASAVVLVLSVAVGLRNRVVARNLGRLVISITGLPREDVRVRRISIALIAIGAIVAVLVLAALASQ